MGHENSKTRRFWATFALLAVAWYGVLLAMPGASSLVRNASPSINAETTPASLATGCYAVAVLVIAWPVRWCALRGGRVGYVGAVLLVPLFDAVHFFVVALSRDVEVDVELAAVVAGTVAVGKLAGLRGMVKALAAVGTLWVLRRAGGLSTPQDTPDVAGHAPAETARLTRRAGG